MFLSLQMEKTVDFEENMVIQKELEMLFGCSVSSRLLHGSFTWTQLQQLGLFIKDDDDDEEGLDFDGEEGEIFSWHPTPLYIQQLYIVLFSSSACLYHHGGWQRGIGCKWLFF